MWSAEQLRTFLDVTVEHPLHVAWFLAATTGMRRGEVLGLRWNDVDLDASRLAVTRAITTVNNQIIVTEPKTSRSRRSIALDAATVARLREHRKAQAEARFLMGPADEDRGLVVAEPDGSPSRPIASPASSTTNCDRPTSPGFGSTTSDTATPRWPSLRVSTPRSSATASATPTSRSPSTSTPRCARHGGRRGRDRGRSALQRVIGQRRHLALDRVAGGSTGPTSSSASRPRVGTTSRRPSRTAGISLRRTSSYARPREIPRRSAACSTVTVSE